MNLVAYTATALSRNDIEDTPTNKNIVDGAIVELKDLDGNLVVIYDDAAGANPETQKSCDTNGQLTFWTEVGDYILIVNGSINFITIGASIKFTQQSRQAIEAVYKAQGYNDVFFFEDGFTYEESNDVGIYEDGTAWIYADAGALPVTIAAGTVPSEGVYEAVSVKASSVILDDGSSVQDFKGDWEELSQKTATFVTESIDWYVDPLIGVDDLSEGRGLSDTMPFKTPQFCIDIIPKILNDRYQQTINLAEGVYNESSRLASEMPRPAIIYPSGKYISKRTSQSGNDLSGSLIIKGAGVDLTIIETNPAEGYVNGIYVSGTEIGVQDLTVRPKSGGGTSTCMTSHRGAYIHGRNLKVGGAGASLGLVNESTGWSEMVSCEITGSDNKDVVVFPTSGCSLAGANSNIGDVQSSGFIQFAQQLTVNGDVAVTSGGTCQITSNVASNKVVFNGAVSLSNTTLSAAFAEFNAAITSDMSFIKLSACNYGSSITLFGGGLDLNASNSFVSPSTVNSSLTPVVLRNDAAIIKDLASTIVNSGGIEVGADYGNLVVTVSSNGFSIPVSVTGRSIDLELIGSSSNRTGAVLPALGATGVYPDGTELRIVGAGFNVEIIESATANIPNGSITVGGLSGSYSGATFVYSSRSSKWNLQAVGLMQL